jgi:hypothetical protein
LPSGLVVLRWRLVKNLTNLGTTPVGKTGFIPVYVASEYSAVQEFDPVRCARVG